MCSTDERLSRLMLAVAPVAIIAAGYGLLPSSVVGNALNILMAWLTLSLPVGVLAGHCILSDADQR